MEPQSVIFNIVTQLGDVLLAWGWLLLLGLALWIAWEIYIFLKHADYTASIQWTYYQVTVPDEISQTPKALENAIDVWGGMHKDPDLIERLFEGYFLPWYSLEVQATKGRARYILVVPTPHAKFFEGVIYGQYPAAEISEVEDYTQRYSYEEIGKTFDMWGAEIHLVEDDIYPIRLYREFEDIFNEDDTFVDPHQAMIETLTNINDGEEFWIQVLVKPIDAADVKAWAERGQEKIRELAGADPDPGKQGIIARAFELLVSIPQSLFVTALQGPQEAADAKKKDLQFHIYNPTEDAEMKGILQKVSRTGYLTKIRVMHFAPVGKLHKPNYGKAVGVFKQFNSFHLNSFKPDGATKTNGPNYILKQTRRDYRTRAILLNFQWRDFWGDNSGQMMNAEEIATIYHFPGKYVRVPSVERASAGAGAPPSNVPYV